MASEPLHGDGTPCCLYGRGPWCLSDVLFQKRVPFPQDVLFFFSLCNTNTLPVYLYCKYPPLMTT